MRIGILVPSIGAFGQKGFYNAQEIGLAKALDKLCDEVKVYRLVSMEQEEKTEKIDNCEHTTAWFLSSRKIGNNGLLKLSVLDRTLDVLIVFSDMQLIIPAVARWAKRNHVRLLPYIGVVESHSTSAVKRWIVDALFRRNLAVYRKHQCFAKTPQVQKQLNKMGVEDVSVAPVGLDLTLMKQDAFEADSAELKRKYGYCEEDKVLLFIGRLTEEKQPLLMIELFAQIYATDHDYRLLMVGTGELKEQVADLIEKHGLSKQIRMLDRIPNKDIWELYRLAECFVNLNRQEIFGMAILEAMYYGCKVVAWEAPGPSFIIEDGVSGWLANNSEAMCTAICNKPIGSAKANEKVRKHFTWENSAEKIVRVAKRTMGNLKD